MIAAIVLACLLQEQVDNPEYKAWASLKPGSWVKSETLWARKGDQRYILTHVLKSVSETEVQVEMTAPIGDGPESSVSLFKIPARIPAPVTKTLRQGDEEIEVAGRKLRCHWVEYEWDSPIDHAQVTREWSSSEVPGGRVRTDDRRKEPSDSAWGTRQIATAWEKK